MLDDLLADVLLAHIAVIVDKDLEDHHGVLANLIEALEDELLVMVGSVTGVEQLEEDSLKEDLDDVLEVLAEVREEAEED